MSNEGRDHDFIFLLSCLILLSHTFGSLDIKLEKNFGKAMLSGYINKDGINLSHMLVLIKDIRLIRESRRLPYRSSASLFASLSWMPSISC